jgi:hypothetical protein
LSFIVDSLESTSAACRCLVIPSNRSPMVKNSATGHYTSQACTVIKSCGNTEEAGYLLGNSCLSPNICSQAYFYHSCDEKTHSILNCESKMGSWWSSKTMSMHILYEDYSAFTVRMKHNFLPLIGVGWSLVPAASYDWANLQILDKEK